MGSRPQVPAYAILAADQGSKASEPEEYDLDTFTLPVDAAVNSILKGTARLGPKDSSSALRFMPKKLTAESNGRLLNSCSIKQHSKFSFDNTGGSKLSKKGPKVLEDSSRGKIKSIGNFHDDSATNSSSTFHVHTKKGAERRTRAHQPETGFVNTADMDGTMGNGRPGRKHHQPTFLKTLSIIDTLSDLGPEVRQLAEEPKQTISTKPPHGSRSSKYISNDATRAEFLHTGPPSVSVHFQQYTEKIYDAVTRRSEIPALRTKHSHTGLTTDASKHLTFHTKTTFKNGVRSEGTNSIRKLKRRISESRERGRTPDWIKRIFDIAKRGDLDAIKQGVSDMEDTLVRNLTDHAGNNLLHVMAVYGHLNPLAWILTTQSILIGALQDENKYGLTPLVCSIKYGQLLVVQWLVENNCIKDKVKCKDGERSLLHIASKYAQEDIVAWLVSYMMNHDISLDNKDHHGNTALHLVARTGNSRVCSILLQHGADVTLKNDLGQKAWEVCVIRGHLACAEYLCVHESGLALATDLTRREAELEAAMADNHDMRLNFKEVMNIARRLIREREEAVRELSRLHEQMVEAHDNIMALHVLSEEQRIVNGVRPPSSQKDQVESVINYVTNLHERWQTIQKSWFGSSLVHMKHRMLLVEEAWKKLRHRSHRTVATTHHPLDVFRGKLCAVRAQGGEGKLGDLPSLCSSEESLASLFPFTDNEEEEESNYETLPSSSTPKVGSIGLSSHILNNRADVLNCNESLTMQENISSVKYPMEDDTLQYSVDKKISIAGAAFSPHDSSNVTLSKFGEYQTRPYWTDPSLSASLNIVTDLSPGQLLPKNEINARLKEYALTSESGSCSVLEVIEPSSEESESLIEDERRNKITYDDRLADEISVETKVRNNHDRKSKIISRSKWDNGDISEKGETMTSSESSAESISSRELLHNKSSDGKHFLAIETSVGAVATDVSNKEQRLIEPEEGQEQYINNTPFKRKGFFNKLIKPSHWPTKRKSKSIRKLDQDISHEVINLSLGRENKVLVDVSSVDIDAQTTPESNTSSSQEYSNNSSEESSIGKPTSRPTDSMLPYALHIDSESKSIIACSNNCPDTERSQENPHTASLHPVTVPSGMPPPIPTRRSIISTILTDKVNQDYHVDRDNPSQRLENPTKLIISEARSIATSEDSGIVAARSSSSASKSESVSRPESSSSNFPSFKNEYLLRKSNLSLTQDMLPSLDSSNAGRMSPAPSEVSKTESALSPPSDISKSESLRQTSLGKGSLSSSTNSNCSKDGSAGSSDYSVTILPLKKEMDVKTDAIIGISCDHKLTTTLETDMSESITELQRQQKERPWYELSDEESDILLPDRLSTICVPQNTSSEDETEIC